MTVDVNTALGQMEAQLDATVTERRAQRELDVLRACPTTSELFDEVGHLAASLVAGPTEMPVDNVLHVGGSGRNATATTSVAPAVTHADSLSTAIPMSSALARYAAARGPSACHRRSFG